MKFIEIRVKTAKVVHGFDEHNQELVEDVYEPEFVTKLVAIQRIQSISQDYILVTGSHGRIMYWQYDAEMADVVKRLSVAGLVVE